MRAFRVLGSFLVSIQLVACVTGDNVTDDPSTEATATGNDSDADQLPDEDVEAVEPVVHDDNPRAPVNEEMPELKPKQPTLPGLHDPGCGRCLGR